MKLRRKIPAGRIIALGFLALILLGALLLWLPISHREGTEVSCVDALFIATSATCVTGLTPLTVSETFNTFGTIVIGGLIQIGGLGIACIGASFVWILRRRVRMKNQSLLREGWNVSGSGELLQLLKTALILTFSAEGVGALLCLPIFLREMPLSEAIGCSVFHAVSSFNNAGFDLLGADSLGAYSADVPFLLITALLIIAGGLGFIVYWDLLAKRSFRKLSLHSKVVLSTTAVLLLVGTLLLLCTQDMDLPNAAFYSVSARTAGFATIPASQFSQASIFIIILLMFIGASPGSTGGGIKTTTFFVICLVTKNLFHNKKAQAFRRRLPQDVISKAFLLVFLALAVLCLATLLLCILEPQIPFLDLLYEVVSAGATVGLSTGITASLSTASKLVLTLVMYIGRLGPLTAATIWTIKQESTLSYSSEPITIG